MSVARRKDRRAEESAAGASADLGGDGGTRSAGADLRPRVDAVARRFSDAAPGSMLDLAPVSLVLLALAAIAYGPHVIDGGFTYVDWSHAEFYRRGSERDGFAGAVSEFWAIDSYRPAATVYLPLVHGVLGLHMGFHLLWSVLLATLAALLFFGVLRQLGVGRLPAATIAALALVYPWSDSTVLWATAGIAHFAISAYFLGLLLAFAAFRQTANRAIALHVLSWLAYAVSVLSYEITLGGVVAAPLLYALYCRAWRPVRKRGAADLALAVATLWFTLAAPFGGARDAGIGAVDGLFRRAGELFDAAVTLFAADTLRLGADRVALIGLVLVVIAGLLLARPEKLAPHRAAELRGWAAVAACGVAAVAVGYVMFIGADSYYTPLGPGVQNRTNAFATYGLVTVAYAVLALGGVLVAGILGRPRLAPVLATVAALALVISYVSIVRDDGKQWDLAFMQQQDVLNRLSTAVAQPEPGTAVFAFGFPGWVAPGVPLFVESWDLQGAAQLYWRTGAARAFPIVDADNVVCAPDEVRSSQLPAARTAYDNVLFVDIPTQRVAAVPDAAACRELAPAFKPPG